MTSDTISILDGSTFIVSDRRGDIEAAPDAKRLSEGIARGKARAMRSVPTPGLMSAIAESIHSRARL